MGAYHLIVCHYVPLFIHPSTQPSLSLNDLIIIVLTMYRPIYHFVFLYSFPYGLQYNVTFIVLLFYISIVLSS